MNPNDTTASIIDAAICIHRKLGPGLLESVYSAVLAHELAKRGMRVAREAPIPVTWESLHLEIGFRADLLVEDAVIVELKSVEEVAPVHYKQLLTYLRLAEKRIGLLLNFGRETMKEGITRMVNGLNE